MIRFTLCAVLAIAAMLQPIHAQVRADNMLRRGDNIDTIRETPVVDEKKRAAMQQRLPDSVSPFFLERDLEYQYVLPYATDTGPQVELPKVRDSFGDSVNRFVRGIFASLRTWGNPGYTGATIEVDPNSFSLTDRREISSTYTVTNQTSRMIRLEFPTAQRFEMVTRGPDGAVIERWSDDRAFNNQDGFLVINPKERVEYSEQIPTRDMKAGSNYTVEAAIVDHPIYDVQTTISPRE